MKTAIEIYDTMFGTNYSKIETHDFPKLEVDIKKNYVKKFLIKSVFWSEFDKANNSIIFYILRRVQQIVSHYEDARDDFIKFVDSKKKSTDQLFNALNNIEIVISLAYQIVHAFHRLSGEKVFEHNDNSSLCRLNICYNEIKHLEKKEILSPKMIYAQTTYLKGDRFCTLKSFITYCELKEIIIELIEISDYLLSGEVFKQK